MDVDSITAKSYGLLTLSIPSVADLFVAKRKRNEPRDRAHEAWASQFR